MNISEQYEPWIGVDLDGTLARHIGWTSLYAIGEPVPEMVARVRDWLAAGVKVKVFTARACDPKQLPYVRKWLDAIDLQEVGITASKDYGIREIWDHIAVPVIRNTGRVGLPEPHELL